MLSVCLCKLISLVRWFFILLFSVAITFGDPHIVTLDGVEYTFNGYGEYDILQVAGPEFKLQGRMEPLIDEHSKTTRATVYRAFALKENSSDILQVMICERYFNSHYMYVFLTAFQVNK